MSRRPCVFRLKDSDYSFAKIYFMKYVLRQQGMDFHRVPRHLKVVSKVESPI